MQIVPKETIARNRVVAAWLAGLGIFARTDGPTLNQVEVQVAVVVEVEQRAARPHDLRKVELSSSTAVVDEVEPGLARAVFELRLPASFRGCLWRNRCYRRNRQRYNGDEPSRSRHG